jgi:hypothetical protein
MSSSVGATEHLLHETNNPFRKGLSEAIQWIDALRIEYERDLERVLSTASEHVKRSGIPAQIPDPWPGPLPSQQLVASMPPYASVVDIKGPHVSLRPDVSTPNVKTLTLETHRPSGSTTLVRGMNGLSQSSDDRSDSTQSERPLSPSRLIAQSPISDEPRNGMSARIEHDVHKEQSALESDGRQSSGKGESTLQEGECDRYLQQLCPACFGGSQFGHPLEWYVSFPHVPYMY